MLFLDQIIKNNKFLVMNIFSMKSQIGVYLLQISELPTNYRYCYLLITTIRVIY